MIKPEEIGGVDTGWKTGSLFSNEGMRLYNLVRELKPKVIVEVGAWEGCSTSYLACGVRDNGFGKVISIDITKGAGSQLAEELKHFVEFRCKNALEYVPKEKIDFVFEDGSHLTGFTESIAERYKASMVFVSHDYCHRTCFAVTSEFDKVFGKPDEIFFEPPSDCGLAIKYT